MSGIEGRCMPAGCAASVFRPIGPRPTRANGQFGASRAFELLLTGRFVEAEEAERIGLVSRLVPRAELMDTALETARAIAAHAPYGVRMTKQVMWSQLEISSQAAGLDLENRTQVSAALTEDHREAVAAFLGKRAPVFHNR